MRREDPAFLAELLEDRCHAPDRRPSAANDPGLRPGGASVPPLPLISAFVAHLKFNEYVDGSPGRRDGA